jgi:hypothetical protein
VLEKFIIYKISYFKEEYKRGRKMIDLYESV